MNYLSRAVQICFPFYCNWPTYSRDGKTYKWKHLVVFAPAPSLAIISGMRTGDQVLIPTHLDQRTQKCSQKQHFLVPRRATLMITIPNIVGGNSRGPAWQNFNTTDIFIFFIFHISYCRHTWYWATLNRSPPPGSILDIRSWIIIRTYLKILCSFC